MHEDDSGQLAAWMQIALEEARAAARCGEVPVGAVVVRRGEVVARAHNLREGSRDPLAHAEVLALRSAAAALGRWRLFDCTLVCTLEPCPMCAGAVVNARVDRLVYGASDPRAGAAGTVFDLARDPRLNHQATVVSGVLAPACAALMRQFFATRRHRASSSFLSSDVG